MQNSDGMEQYSLAKQRSGLDKHAGWVSIWNASGFWRGKTLLGDKRSLSIGEAFGRRIYYIVCIASYFGLQDKTENTLKGLSPARRMRRMTIDSKGLKICLLSWEKEESELSKGKGHEKKWEILTFKKIWSCLG